MSRSKLTVKEALAQRKADGITCDACPRPAAWFTRWCSMHSSRKTRWGSLRVRPHWRGSYTAFRRRRLSIARVLLREEQRGNPVVLAALSTVGRWMREAQLELDDRGIDGVARLGSRQRSWVRLWARLGQRTADYEPSSAARLVLATVLLVAEDEMEYDAGARPHAVVSLLRRATRGRGFTPSGLSSDARMHLVGPELVASSAIAPIGRRVLRALEAVIRLNTLYAAERRMGRALPQRPAWAFEHDRPKPLVRQRKRWSHLERRWYVETVAA